MQPQGVHLTQASLCIHQCGSTVSYSQQHDGQGHGPSFLDGKPTELSSPLFQSAISKHCIHPIIQSMIFHEL